MTAGDIAAMMNQAMAAAGGKPEFTLILLGEASAYPHGSGKPQEVRDGEIVLMDCGCSVHGYRSDISRTFVAGEPSPRQRRIWDQVRTGQQIAIEAARPGAPVSSVDEAVRLEYSRLGYPADYRVPGLPHRTGHGIGLDIHEGPYLVRGDDTPLAAGMCFSNEPGLYFPGEFGVRIEDCFYMTADGPRWFSQPPRSLDAPFG
jgi:Xaa-Pro dipeptidase